MPPAFLSFVQLHNECYKPDLGIALLLAVLCGVLLVWYFAGEPGTGLRIYETHLFDQFRKF